ncbi:MAG: S46 family peptidase [bacterium]|nr:MAG: S46 family peptidase [bacterium]
MNHSSFFYILLTLFIIISGLHADEGMWMPHQMQSLHLEELGLKMNPEDLYKKNGSGLMNAIITLGGGTGSFVSQNGLILTNHHVAFSSIQRASDAQNDYLNNGFLAWEKSEELPAPGRYADVLLSYEDITDQIISKLHSDMTLAEKWQVLDLEEKRIIADVEAESPDMRAKIASTFDGKYYYLYRFKRLQDIRIVYAPPLDLGKFGGEIDNWMWPRHTADFTFFRAYVSPENIGREYHPENRPYQPESYLKISLNGFQEGDFTFIMGFPGKTFRNETVAEFNYAIEQMIQRIDQYQAIIDFYESYSQDNRDIELKYISKLKSLHNSAKNYRGKLEGFEKRSILQKKETFENDLIHWVDTLSDQTANYRTIFKQMQEVLEEQRILDKKMELLTDWVSRYFGPNLMYLAHQIYRTVYEREKPDMERDAHFQQRNFTLIKNKILLADREFDLTIDALFFQNALANLENISADQIPRALKKLRLKKKEQNSQQFVTDLYQKSTLTNSQSREKALEMNLNYLLALNDPFIQIAQDIEEELGQLREQEKLIELKRSQISKEYADILLQYKKDRVAPDANSTIRFTYGYIQGYSPMDGVYYQPQTTLGGVIEKHRGQYPFNVPEKLRQLYTSRDYGMYTDRALQDIPVCFLNTTNVTGGNSGSPTLNNKGELIGVIFDMTYESIIGDYYIIPELQRTLSVDIRYILFITEKMAGAKHIIQELRLSGSAG